MTIFEKSSILSKQLGISATVIQNVLRADSELNKQILDDTGRLTITGIGTARIIICNGVYTVRSASSKALRSKYKGVARSKDLDAKWKINAEE